MPKICGIALGTGKQVVRTFKGARKMTPVLSCDKVAACETWEAKNALNVFMASGEEVSQPVIPGRWLSLAAFHRLLEERRELSKELTSLQAEVLGS